MSSWKIRAPFTGFTWHNHAPCSVRYALGYLLYAFIILLLYSMATK